MDGGHVRFNIIKFGCCLQSFLTKGGSAASSASREDFVQLVHDGVLSDSKVVLCEYQQKWQS